MSKWNLRSHASMLGIQVSSFNSIYVHVQLLIDHHSSKQQRPTFAGIKQFLSEYAFSNEQVGCQSDRD
jgi:hypothetical protein